MRETTEKSSGARIFIVESDDSVADDLQKLLFQLGYVVAGVEGDAGQAYDRLTSLRPDLVLMDAAVEDGSQGYDAAQRIRTRSDLPVVMVASNDDQQMSAERVARGCTKRELHGAIEFALYRHAHEAKVRKMADRVLDALNYVNDPIFMADDRGNLIFINQPAKAILEEAGTAGDPALVPRSLPSGPTNGRRLPRGMDAVSRREMEVLGWFLRGFGTATIGMRLQISAQTIRNHLKSICKKLDVRSQIELRELFAQDN